MAWLEGTRCWLSAFLCCVGVSAIRDRTRTARCVQGYADSLDLVRAGLGTTIRSHPLTVTRTSNRPLILGAGSGSSGTTGLFHALAGLGAVTLHWMTSHGPEGLNKTGNPWTYELIRILGGGVWPEAEAVQARSRGAVRYEGAKRCRARLRSYDYAGIPADVDAVTDTPAAELFLPLFLSFPRARVVLTTRPAAAWARSRLERTGNFTFVPLQEPCGLTLVSSRARHLSRADLARLYVLNNKLVRCLVPPEQLLILHLPVQSTAHARWSYTRQAWPWLQEFLQGGGRRHWRGRNRTWRRFDMLGSALPGSAPGNGLAGASRAY